MKRAPILIRLEFKSEKGRATSFRTLLIPGDDGAAFLAKTKECMPTASNEEAIFLAILPRALLREIIILSIAPNPDAWPVKGVFGFLESIVDNPASRGYVFDAPMLTAGVFVSRQIIVLKAAPLEFSPVADKICEAVLANASRAFPGVRMLASEEYEAAKPLDLLINTAAALDEASAISSFAAAATGRQRPGATP